MIWVSDLNAELPGNTIVHLLVQMIYRKTDGGKKEFKKQRRAWLLRMKSQIMKAGLLHYRIIEGFSILDVAPFWLFGSLFAYMASSKSKQEYNWRLPNKKVPSAN